jgi:ribosomal protein S7
MINNKIKVIKKLINHMTKHGKKSKSEKKFLQSIKELQKPIKKRSQDIITYSV